MNGEFLFKRALLEINVSSEPIFDKSLMISVLYLLEILLVCLGITLFLPCLVNSSRLSLPVSG